jgi:hypothetical protein
MQGFQVDAFQNNAFQCLFVVWVAKIKRGLLMGVY